MSNSRVRRVSPDGTITTYAMAPNPFGVAVAGDGTVYVTLLNNRISRITPAGARVIAGSGERGYAGDGGPAEAAQFSFSMSGIAVDARASVFVADSGNHRIRRVGPDGVVDTVAGTGTAGYAGDGGPARAAQFANPQGVAAAADGSLYVADTGNNRVRRITPDGIVRTIAGNGTRGMSGNKGPAPIAQLNEPVRVAVDAAGNVYIADRVNGHIRKVDAAGIISTIAGSAPPPGVPGGVFIPTRP
jgi:sugar lactone lactonase YvrE